MDKGQKGPPQYTGPYFLNEEIMDILHLFSSLCLYIFSNIFNNEYVLVLQLKNKVIVLS